MDLPWEMGGACVEHAGRPVAVAAQGAEERRAVPRRDAVHDGQVQFQRPLAGVEDAPEMVAEPAGQVLDGDLRHQVQVQLRPDPGQGSGQDLGAFIWRVVHQVIGSEQAHELPERGRVVDGPVSKAAADHARLQPEVQPRGHQCVVEARHDDDLVDELIVRATPPAQLLAQ